MIRNVIFDLGGVMVEFNPPNYMRRIGFSEEKIEKLHQMIFKDPRWNEFDRGTIQIQEYIEELMKENPEYTEDLKRFFKDDWISKMFLVKEETVNFLKEISKLYNVYILSNVPEIIMNYIKSLEFFKYFNGGTYSYVNHKCKPENEIYEELFESFKLVPEECLFLDDREDNIEKGLELGMHGIVFNNNFEDIKKYLNEN